MTVEPLCATTSPCPHEGPLIQNKKTLFFQSTTVVGTAFKQSSHELHQQTLDNGCLLEL